MERSLEDIKKVPKRKYPDDFDLGDLTLLDLIHAEKHLKELQTMLRKIPVNISAQGLPLKWHVIFITGMADIMEWQEIARLQGKM